MKRTLFKGLTLAAALSGGGLAASGCTALYATTSTSSVSKLHFVSSTSQVTDMLTLTGTTVNAAALDPQTGNIFYINRSAAGQNDLHVVDPDTLTNTLVAAVAEPTNAVAIGASFDNGTSGSRLFIFYNNYQIQEVDKTTGAALRTLSINLPATDTSGNLLRKTTTATSNTTTTSGDIIFLGNTLYGVLDGESATAGAVYYLNLGVPPSTGTTGTLTGNAAVRLGNGTSTTVFAPKSINGIAINPVNGTTYITSNPGGTNQIGTLNTSSGLVTQQTTSPSAFNDFTDCAVLPDKPTISKAFAASPIRLNTSTTLTITLGNTNPSSFYTEDVITDSLPAGLTVAAAPNASTTCTLADGSAATLTAAAGSTSVTLPRALRVPPGGCTATVSVTGTTAGLKNNVIAASGVITTAGTPTANATATLTVNAPVTGTLQKTQRNVTQGGTAVTTTVNGRPGDIIEYCVTATHPGVGTADATVADLKDTLATPLTLVTGAYGGRDVQLTRGATVTTLTAVAGDDAATLAGRTLSVNILPWNSSNTTARVCFQARIS